MSQNAVRITVMIPAGLKVIVRVTASGLEIIVQGLGSSIDGRLRAVGRQLARCVGALVKRSPCGVTGK